MDALSGIEGGPWKGVLFHGVRGRRKVGGGRARRGGEVGAVGAVGDVEHCGSGGEVEDATVAVMLVSQRLGLGVGFE